MGEWEEERRNNFVHLKESFFQIIFDEVRERTWLGSSLWQKDLLFKAGLSCISENHLAIMQRRNSFWNVHETRAAGHGIYTATNALIRADAAQYAFSEAKDWT